MAQDHVGREEHEVAGHDPVLDQRVRLCSAHIGVVLLTVRRATAASALARIRGQHSRGQTTRGDQTYAVNKPREQEKIAMSEVRAQGARGDIPVFTV